MKRNGRKNLVNGTFKVVAGIAVILTFNLAAAAFPPAAQPETFDGHFPREDTHDDPLEILSRLNSQINALAGNAHKAGEHEELAEEVLKLAASKLDQAESLLENENRGRPFRQCIRSAARLKLIASDIICKEIRKDIRLEKRLIRLSENYESRKLRAELEGELEQAGSLEVVLEKLEEARHALQNGDRESCLLLLRIATAVGGDPGLRTRERRIH